ncbi:sugar/nucleoside kinase (ribokinase family) [Microbacterium resistens]|uniref:Sugar/nucleoside kinase (Ribokinase family) n=1 Tax=Microbacterium resistens TaxID=156977 RepID=A0ABU1SBB5_9MICO|nr:PfkB family carbohydrate kinase [Microbacterium resistens]MDR6866911.1 sugar/nucleoside kinase (ribokinase family) [Microbacterium resistens]
MTTPFEWDLAVAGPVFLDYGLAELGGTPAPGTEVFAGAVGISPGGVANLSVAASRLGLRTILASTFGDDLFGDWCRAVLRAEGVDLSPSRIGPGLVTPVTIAVAHDGDREMVTYQPGRDDLRVDELPAPARALVTDLRSLADGTDTRWRAVADGGTRIFADIGWDDTERWDLHDLDPLSVCGVFTPNEREAMAYTRTDDPVAAARALGERVPLVVVTRGADGAVAIDAARGIEVSVPALPTTVLDPTGAGDVFAAALVRASLLELSIDQEVAFAVLAAGLAVARRGSALSAPSWGDIDRWWGAARRDADLAARYGFLDDIVPADPGPPAPAAPDRLLAADVLHQPDTTTKGN